MIDERAPRLARLDKQMNPANHIPRHAQLQAFAMFTATVLATFALSSNPVLAQGYPEKPIRVIVPWPAGGIADVVTRIVTQPLSERLQQPIVVDNRPGANGILAANIAAKSPADGYTLFSVTSEIVSINPAVYAKLPYDAISNFVPITPVVKYFYTLTGRSDLRADTVKELVALIKSQPGKFTYGSWGMGSVGHLGMEMLSQSAGLQMLHVPFNGGPPAYNAVVGGQVDMVMMPAGIADPFRKGGKLKAIAVPMENRLFLMDNVSTMKEQGFDLVVINHVGFLAPAKTPSDIVKKLHAAISGVMQMPEVQAALKAQAADPFVLSPEEYSRFLSTELTRWGTVARKANISLELN